MDKATAPLDLLKELRAAYAYDAIEHRKREQQAFSLLDQRAAAARALACETAVKRIDATLRDWG